MVLAFEIDHACFWIPGAHFIVRNSFRTIQFFLELRKEDIKKNEAYEQ